MKLSQEEKNFIMQKRANLDVTECNSLNCKESSKLKNLIAKLKESMEEWKEQVSINDDGWSYRNNDNRLNNAASMVYQTIIEEIDEILNGTI